MVQQQSAVRKIFRRDGDGEGRVMFGAPITRRYSLGVLALVVLSGTTAQSAPQVTQNGFLVKFEVNVNAPAAKVYDALVGQVGSWWNPEHTYSHDAKNLSIDARPGGCFCESCLTVAESNIFAWFTSLRLKLCGSPAHSDRYRPPVLLEA